MLLETESNLTDQQYQGPFTLTVSVAYMYIQVTMHVSGAWHSKHMLWHRNDLVACA